MLNLIDVFFVCIVVYLVLRWNFGSHWDFGDKIPGYNGMPIVGIWYQYFSVKFEDAYANFLEIAKPFDSVFKIWWGLNLILFIRKPEDIKILLNADESYDKPKKMYKTFFNRGLFVSSGEKNRLYRKTMSIILDSKAMQTYIPTINIKMKNFLKSFDEKLKENGDEMDISKHTLDFALIAILSSMFGCEDFNEDERLKFLQDVEESFKIKCEKSYNIWLAFEPVFKFTNKYKRLKKHESSISDFVEIIETGVEKNINKVESTDKKFYPPLEQIYEITKLINHFELKDEISTIVISGSQKTGKVIAATILMLAMNPNKQEKVIDELVTIFNGKSDQIMDERTLNRMKYLEMVVKETIRLLPPIPQISRQIRKDIELADLQIPAGVIVSFFPQIIHTDKKYWGDDADEFIPERFSDTNFSKIHPYAYIPFSNGERSCIGDRYAWNVIKTFLSQFLMRYRVTTKLKFAELKLYSLFTLNIKQGFMVNIEKR